MVIDPLRGTRHGTAPAPLSVLHNVMTGTGYTAPDSLASMIRMAEFAEQRGFTRYWVAEHHSMPGVSTASPAVLLARLTGHTGADELLSHPRLTPLEAQYQSFELIADAYNMPTTQTGEHYTARTTG